MIWNYPLVSVFLALHLLRISPCPLVTAVAQELIVLNLLYDFLPRASLRVLDLLDLIEFVDALVDYFIITL